MSPNPSAIRISAAILFALAATAALGQGDDLRPRLRASAVVRGDVVRIGDVIDNAGVVANVAIFRAPDLGDTGSVSASSIADAVRAHAIVGLDHAGIADVTVTRVSRTISAPEVEREVTRALAAQYGLGDPRALALTFDRELRALHVEPSPRNDLRIGRIAYDQRSGRFDVLVAADGTRTLRLSGTALPSIETIALQRPLTRGETIKAGDIAIERRPRSEAGADPLGTSDIIVGMVARNALRAGQVLRSSDLMKQELVARDAAVTLIYEVPGITLTVRGKAVEGGAEGDIISVLNLQSKRTVQGTIAGPGRVVVGNSALQPTASTARMRLSSNTLTSAE